MASSRPPPASRPRRGASRSDHVRDPGHRW